MGIIFEEVTGELESKRGDAAATSSAPASQGPSEEQILQIVADYARIAKERCVRSLAD